MRQGLLVSQLQLGNGISVGDNVHILYTYMYVCMNEGMNVCMYASMQCMYIIVYPITIMPIMIPLIFIPINSPVQ